MYMVPKIKEEATQVDDIKHFENINEELKCKLKNINI